MKFVGKLSQKQIVSQVPTKASLTFQSTWEFIPQMVSQNLETYFFYIVDLVLCMFLI